MPKMRAKNLMAEKFWDVQCVSSSPMVEDVVVEEDVVAMIGGGMVVVETSATFVVNLATLLAIVQIR
jgi:hypothetical protein